MGEAGSAAVQTAPALLPPRPPSTAPRRGVAEYVSTV
jgi:hypothetical protein